MNAQRVGRVERLATRRGLRAPKTWRFFEYEDGVYRPALEWRGGEPGERETMTPAQFERWRADHPDVGIVIERIVAGWRGR